ncbi:hypothetical protein F4561_002866 [Lipingzhangella halophila]|uniref:Penicillin-binding protein n=1 Tax=Lipingzhangella halophila TaxID=1783352 RepID=A0A7W7RHD8_9ACTN|nr:penicillin-binding transpeptidase domain-containing protein [Lipingzhangella halophila]MBB4932046.1 hypothetical protein [Lipingzhangella halophila]
MDERWTPGQGDDQPSPPPDPQDPPSGDPEPPQAREAEETPASDGTSDVSADSDGIVGAETGGESAAGAERTQSTASPYTIPGAGDTRPSSWSWTSTEALDDGWGATGSPVARPWLDDPGLPDAPTAHEKPEPPSAPEEPSNLGGEPADSLDGVSRATDEPAEHFSDFDQAAAESQEDIAGWRPDEPARPEDAAHEPWGHTEEPTLRPWEHTETPTHQAWEQHTETPTHQAWDHTNEPTHQAWDHTEEPTLRPWEHTETPTHQAWEQHTETPTHQAWDHTNEPTHQAWDHTEEPTLRPWEHTETPTHQAWDHTEEPTLRPWEHTETPTHQAWEQHTETPTHQAWDHTNEPTHQAWDHTEEPTLRPWEHTETPTHQAWEQHTETPTHQAWDHTNEPTHQAWDHTEEPTLRPWEHTNEPTNRGWDHWQSPTGQAPTAYPSYESDEPASSQHQSLDDTASFSSPSHHSFAPFPPQQSPDSTASHHTRETPHSPYGAWDSPAPSSFQRGDQALSDQPPMPDPHGLPGDSPAGVPYATGPSVSDPESYSASGPAGRVPDAGAPPRGPYDPAYEPAGDFAAFYQDSGPEDPSPPVQEQEGPGGPDHVPPRRSRKGLVIGLVSTVVALALIGGGISWYVLSMPKPEETAASYAAAWGEGDYAAMAGLAAGNSDDTEQNLDQFASNLGVTEAQVDMGEVSADGDNATAPYEATLSLKNAGDWSYEGELPMVRQDGEWLVDFSPAVMHPELDEGQTLARVNAWGERGNILAADGSRLDTEETSGSLAMIVGQVGSAEEEDLESLGPAYEVGDPTGASGLQKSYEERLAGEAGTAIHLVNEGEEDQAAQEEDPTVLESIEGTDGKDVTTSLDPAVQSAAAQAVSGQSDPTAITAIRASTGEILASANVPGGYNRAFEGQYAPGSAFKIVSYQGLLANGLGANDTMSCPEEANVGGWDFKNAGDAAYGQQTVTEAFATSCNTALVQEVANRLDSESITAAAERFGMNSDLDIGVPTTEPSFPAPDSTTMVASQSIGQGQILTSPLHMATVPAAIADGSWRSPTLVSEPEMPDQPEPTQIEHADQLRPMMREVVTNGTADGANFSGEVHGKTGSAEFGTAEDEDDELETHAWFVGYKGDVAFSVVVEGGGGGGDVAAPIGAKFANAI